MKIIFNTDFLKEYGLSTEEIENSEIILSVNIFGVNVPSKKTMETVLNKWSGIRNVRKIIMLNNRFMIDHAATFDPEKFIHTCTDLKTKKILQIYLDTYNNCKKQCDKAGLIFILVWRSIIVLKWFHFMLGNSRGSGSKEIGDELSRIIEARTNQSPYISSSKLGLKDLPLLDKYPEYAEANLHFIAFMTITNIISDTDPEMEELKIADFRIAKRLTNFANHTRTDYHSFICPICQEDINILYSGKIFEFCGSSDCDFCNELMIRPRGKELAKCNKCEKKYSAGTTAKNRLQPYAINKKSMEFSRKDFKKAFDGKRNKCDGCGAKRKILYVFGMENLCRNCIKKSLSR